ncbi:hypothetical protein ACHAXS_004298 [Conticribra weissflogii]
MNSVDGDSTSSDASGDNGSSSSNNDNDTANIQTASNVDASNTRSAPSLLRIGLTAGYVSLAQKRNTPTSSGLAKNESNNDAGADRGESNDVASKSSILSTHSRKEDAAVLTLLQTAGNGALRRLGTPSDPMTSAALSASGQSCHSSWGVLVNVIDPSTPLSNGAGAGAAGGPSFNYASPAATAGTNATANAASSSPYTGLGMGMGMGMGIIPSSPGGVASAGKNFLKNFRGGSSSSAHSAEDSSFHHSNSSNPNNPNSNNPNAQHPHPPLNLFAALQTTFSHLYNSTLHSLPYSHPRTSTPGTIARLPVRFRLHAQPVGTPALWHEGPYCHIYIARCEGLEHYRAKVRPAVRAFVGQIEGSGAGLLGASGVGGSSYGPGGHGAGVGHGSGHGSVGGSAHGSGGHGNLNSNNQNNAGNATASSNVAGNFATRYIIVFVPTGPCASVSGGPHPSQGNPGGGGGGGVGTNSSGSGGGGGGFGGFRASSKKKHLGGTDDENASIGTATTSSSSTHDGTTTTAAHHDAAAAAALPPGPISHTSKEVKELYHKFMKDFPNGRTVIMGTLLDDSSVNSTNLSHNYSLTSPLKNQEWKAFLHNLGGAIADGFGDRVKRYDEELRRLDARRAASSVASISQAGSATHPVSSSNGVNANGTNAMEDHEEENIDKFDLSHFFLVKESLAFTYEQMQLPDEAKLQYEELEAFLPEDAWRRKRRHQLSSNSGSVDGWLGNEADGTGSSDKGDTFSSGKKGVSTADLAMAGDSEGFRQHIQSSGSDLQGVSLLIHQYIYAREVRLLFQMCAPVEVLMRSKDFLVKGHRNRLLDVAVSFRKRWEKELWKCKSDKVLETQAQLKRELSKKEAEVEAWALSSCWDVKCAAEHYFSFDATAPPLKKSTMASVGKKGKDNFLAAAMAPRVEDREAARCLAELLEFAILRLIRLGDLALSLRGCEGKVNPIRRATSERPVDTLEPWESWKTLQQRRESTKRKGISIESPSEPFPSFLPAGVTTWLRTAFTNSSTYEETYLELADATVLLNRRAGRFRFASRLEDHRAEVLISRGEHDLAASILSNNVGACARDQWNRAHYWRIFRLACCQRMSGDVLAYLETLTQSFNPRLASVAPKKTASLFQKDLEAIITDAAVSEPRWGAFPFLETELSIESKTAGKTSEALPFLRRKLAKHLCFVGDELKFGLNINSHLPRHISVNGIRLYLVTAEKYELVYRRNGIVTEDDAFRVLNINSPIVIKPGKNHYSFTWQPMTYNSYVLASVEIQWKEASFFYDSALLRKPMIGLDIQPSEPTQLIELNPLFLIPGHVQNVRLVFNSVSDIITEGFVKFICSDGLQVVPPKTDPTKLEESWSNECIVPLGSCEPGKRIVITTLVKSASMKHAEGGDNVQTMKAKVETLYHHKSYSEVMKQGHEPKSRPMKTLLEAMVTTLDRPALTVDDADAFMFGDDRVMVNVSLRCNTPVPFYIKEWNLDLPPPLVVEEDGDLNKGMFRHAVPEGEVLLMGFKCIRTSVAEDEPTSERPILRVVLQDDFGKTFLQVLPINLEDIYKQLRKEDMYAEIYNATAELTCSAEEGTVGHPVPFSYKLNLESLMLPKRRKSNNILSAGQSIASEVGCPILYTIISDGSDWIVSGKIQGIIDFASGTETLTLHFRGIPTQSGILRNFPELLLKYLPSKSANKNLVDMLPPITVQCRNPDFFKSMAYTTSTSLAAPAGIDDF